MNVLGTEYAHLVQFEVDMLFRGSYPFIGNVSATGALLLAPYGHAAKCHLMGTASDCNGVMEITADFNYTRTETYKGDLTALIFELEFGLYPRGGQAAESGRYGLVELYNSVADKPLADSTRKWLALLSGVKYGLSITLAKVVGASGVDKLEVLLTGVLKANDLPPDTDDDLVDGDCNVVCQYLHKALGTAGVASLSGSLTIEGDVVSVELQASIEGAEDDELELDVGDGDEANVILKRLGFKLALKSR
jgi:hypothetical protein